MSKKIAVAGVPRAGKTTYAQSLPNARSTDELVPLGWSEASAKAAGWFNDNDVDVVEGVAVPRALRKWLEANPEGKPCDEVHWFNQPRIPLTPGQSAMAKGCRTVFDEIRPELERRGVKIVPK